MLPLEHFDVVDVGKSYRKIRSIVTSLRIGNVDAIQENGNLVKGSTIDGDIRLNTKATTLTDIHAGS